VEAMKNASVKRIKIFEWRETQRNSVVVSVSQDVALFHQ
jgi:hypothetical protein